jgi:hypothetical protein
MLFSILLGGLFLLIFVFCFSKDISRRHRVEATMRVGLHVRGVFRRVADTVNNASVVIRILLSFF